MRMELWLARRCLGTPSMSVVPSMHFPWFTFLLLQYIFWAYSSRSCRHIAGVFVTVQGISGYGEHQEHADACKALFGLSVVSFCARKSRVVDSLRRPSISSRRPWFSKFRAALTSTASVEEMGHLLQVKVERWRGKRSRSVQGTHDVHAVMDSSCESDE